MKPNKMLFCITYYTESGKIEHDQRWYETLEEAEGFAKIRFGDDLIGITGKTQLLEVHKMRNDY